MGILCIVVVIPWVGFVKLFEASGGSFWRPLGGPGKALGGVLRALEEVLAALGGILSDLLLPELP